jgi:hypothetical protein
MKTEISPDLWTHPAVAAAAGSLVGLRAMPGTSIVEKLFNLTASFLLAVYVAPWAIDHMNVTSTRLAAGIIFGMGATGLVVFNAVVEAFKKTDLAAYVAGWLPRRKGSDDAA